MRVRRPCARAVIRAARRAIPRSAKVLTRAFSHAGDGAARALRWSVRNVFLTPPGAVAT